MGKTTRVCKICGKEYPFCYTVRHDNAFRWQDVACCPEHGTEYFKRVQIARGEYVEPVQSAAADTVAGDRDDPGENETDS